MPNYITSIPVTEDRLSNLRAVIDRLEAMGRRVTRHGAHQARAQCPVHGGNGLNLSIRETNRGVGFKCWSKGCSPKAIRDALGLGGHDTRHRASPQIPLLDNGRQRANAGDLDRVNRALLARLRLNADHRRNLTVRGLNDDQISRGGYKSLPLRGRARIAGELIAQFGPEVCAGIPGFYVAERNGDCWWSLGGAAGLVIPVRDPEDRIVGIMIRTNDGSKGPRYSSISSKKYRGASPGAPPHLPIYAARGEVVRVTEGPLKADVATCLSGVLTLGIAGVGQWASAIPVLEELSPKTVWLAWDADWRRNPAVACSLADAALELTAKGFHVEVEYWCPDQGKGVDDVLFAGHAPERRHMTYALAAKTRGLTGSKAPKGGWRHG